MINHLRIRRIGLWMIAAAAITELLIVLCYERGVLVMNTYLAPMTFAFAGMTLLCGAYHRRVELWLSAAFCAWYVISRVLMGEMYLEYSYLYLCNLCAAYLLALPFAHCTQDDRQKGMQVFSWLYFGVFGLLAWLSLLPALNDTTLILPWLGTEIGLSYRRLVIGLHPNGTGVVLLISLMMGVWLMVKYRKLWLLIPAVALMLGIYAAIGLTVSRTVMIQAGCFIGGTAAVLCLRLLPWKQLWKKLLIAAPVAAVILAVVFLSFGWITSGAQQLSEALGAVAEETAIYDEAADEELYGDGLVVERDFVQDLTTLTGRTDIWRGVFQLIKAKPGVLVTGLLNSDLEGVLRKYITAPHAHNSILHTLCNMGLPGMLIALFFTLRAAWCALKLIFHQKAAFSDQILAVMLLVWLLGSITESSLFVESFMPCFLPFMLTFGYALEAEHTLKA